MNPDTKAELSALALEKAQRSRTGRPVMTNDRYLTPLRNPTRHSDETVPKLQFSFGLCMILPYNSLSPYNLAPLTMVIGASSPIHRERS